MRTAEIHVTEAGADQRSFTMQLRILDSAIKTKKDVYGAIKKAVRYYVHHTSHGKANFEYNCKRFNWADFESSVPKDICQKFGFEPVLSEPEISFNADWDEQLY